MIRGICAVALVLIAWELIGRYVLTSKLMFAPLSAVLTEFAKLWATGELERHMLVSFTALGVGFAIAAVIAIAIGSLIAISETIGDYVDPVINALYSTPLVAFSPILILAFGIGPASTMAIVFLLVVFPILINTTAGIRSTDASLIEAALSFSASKFEIFRRVLLPSALPFIVAGLRSGWESAAVCRGGSKSLTYPAVDTAGLSANLRIVSRQAHEEECDRWMTIRG